LDTKSKTLTKLLEKIPKKFPKLHVQSLDISYIGEVSGHGSGLYLRIPKEVVDYFMIVAGDRVKIKLIERKNWRDIDIDDRENLSSIHS
jgi:hypothetical protein